MEDYRVELIKILKVKVTEGLETIKGLNVSDKNYASSVLNIVNTDKTAKDLQEQIDFDESGVTDALNKNEDITSIIESEEK